VNLDSICIVGLGLIGGSFAKGLKQTGFNGTITGVFRTAEKGQRAIELGVVDKAETDLAKATSAADLVMLSVPMLSMREQLELIAPSLQPHTIVTDAGSVKTPFIKDAKDVLKDMSRVVPGHPIAGKEKSGIEVADAELYVDHRVLLTPSDETDQDAVDIVRGLWEQLGAVVECMSAEKHDAALAVTSHLPHVLAYATVDTLASRQELSEVFRYAAGGFQDFTRIASGEPIMWRDICLTNKAQVKIALDEFQAHLDVLKEAVNHGDADTIEAVFRRARDARETHVVKKL